MKVLMTTDAVGGVWTYALDLCAALGERDVSVVLATMGPRPSDAQRIAARSLGNVQLVESEYRLEWMDDPWDDVRAAGEWLQELASVNAVSLVHLNGYTHAALPWRRPVVCVAHSCVSTWWQAVHGRQPPARWDTYRRNVAHGLNCADCVVAPTVAFLEQLRDCYEFHRPTRVIHNARAAAAGRTREHSSQDSQRAQPVVLACGRPWDVSKNMRVLDDASRGADWHAYVIGNVTGPDGQTFVPTSLRCLGAQSRRDVDAWLEHADVFVHPALYEPFGLAVLEAAMARCALVLADVPSLRELWDDAAEFFDPRDSGCLRMTLDALMASRDRRQSLAAAAERRASQYRLDVMATAYVDVYRAVGRRSGERAVA